MGTSTLVKWGNGQGVRISRDIMENMGMSIGDRLEVQVRDGNIVMTPKRTRTITIPDFQTIFANYHGPQASEDGFVSPQGKELL